MERIAYNIKKLLPRSIYRKLQPVYHRFLALAGAIRYRFPSRHIKVIGVTGTKGKSTVIDLINAIFEEAGYKTALAGTIHFKIGTVDRRNQKKMTMPGRMFLQQFLREAVDACCDVAIIEMTSEGALQHRHRHIQLDALVFTNLSPEHIESHGSYENYITAKLEIGKSLATSPKKDATLIVNADDKESKRFVALKPPHALPYSIKDAEPITGNLSSSDFNLAGANVHLHLPGIFNVYNALAAATCARAFRIPKKYIVRGLEKVSLVRGRMEEVRLPDKHPLARNQDFTVIVDYAHTPDSLMNVYEVYKDRRTICVLGGTGGGRDRWKRKIMGGIADNYCASIILTNEDPYDEDPRSIISDIEEGIRKTPYDVTINRRAAIRQALERARTGDIVVITGKGTDPYIMEANGVRTPWDDATVVREELENVLAVRASGQKQQSDV